jgi:16S rRNA (cytidine1402-2'-O)-methyltransferase
MPGTLFVVATPIGNLEDITVRALRILREVTVIAAEDTRRTAQLLARHAIATPTTSLHEHNEARKSGALVERLLRGDSVALVSDAGTPTVSDPGGGLIRAAIDAGIRVEPIPGASAVMAGLAASGLPTDGFAFLGFPPTRAKDRKKWLERIRTIRGTIVFFEAPHRIQATLTEIAREFGDCQVAVARELTKMHEEWVRGPINKVAQGLSDPKGEFTVVLSVNLTGDDMPSMTPSITEIGIEFGVLTNNSSTTRRRAVTALARKYGLTPNVVYEMIEDFKKSV